MEKLKFIKDKNFKPPQTKKPHKKWTIEQTTPQLAEAVQHYLFTKNFRWGGAGKTPMHLTARFLDINIFNDNKLTYSNSYPYGKLVTFQQLTQELG